MTAGDADDDTIIHGCSLSGCPEVVLESGVQSIECALCGELVVRLAALAKHRAAMRARAGKPAMTISDATLHPKPTAIGL